MLEMVERTLETRQKIEVTLIASTLTLLYALLTHYLEQCLLEDEGSGSGA